MVGLNLVIHVFVDMSSVSGVKVDVKSHRMQDLVILLILKLIYINVEMLF